MHCDHARKMLASHVSQGSLGFEHLEKLVGVRLFALRAETPASFPQYVHSCKSHFQGAPAGVCTRPSRAFPANQFQCKLSQRSWPEDRTGSTCLTVSQLRTVGVWACAEV